jgi:arylformamidase
MTPLDPARLSDAEINRQFMPRLAVPDHETWLAAHAELSETARRTLPCHLDIAYGDTPLQALDIFPAAVRAPAPVQVFFHGGYWRALDKSTYSFMALSMAPAGIATVLVNYDLCPAVTLDDIVRQTVASVAWVYRNGAAYGCDPERLYVSGNSAGAHLAAMALAQDWRARGLPADVIKGACCITGIYDLAPVLRIDANAEIRLKPEMVARNSPLSLPLPAKPPVIVAVGADETPLWIKQSTDYAAMLRTQGVATELMIIPGAHHFSITRSLADPAGMLPRAIQRQMGSPASAN